MITQLKFHNFRILQDATLPLGRVTVLIGPNGSGKSTALEGIRQLAEWKVNSSQAWRSVDSNDTDRVVSVTVEMSEPQATMRFASDEILRHIGSLNPTEDQLGALLASARVYELDPAAIAEPCDLQRTLELDQNSGNLPAVLTTLQDQHPERFEALNLDLQRWIPEFDRILLDTVPPNRRTFLFRTASGNHRIYPSQLSHGNLVAVALLTLSHLPDPPSIIGLEEIDRGIHPRLLRDVQDAVYRLAYPENYGDDRKPVQVIMTTHSPYFIDLFRDHPEDIVIAEKHGLSASFHRLVDMPNYEEVLRDAHLGEAWYMGALGGVPAGT